MLMQRVIPAFTVLREWMSMGKFIAPDMMIMPVYQRVCDKQQENRKDDQENEMFIFSYSSHVFISEVKQI